MIHRHYIDILWVLIGTKLEGSGIWFDIKDMNSALLTAYGTDRLISGKNSIPEFSEEQFLEKTTEKVRKK